MNRLISDFAKYLQLVITFFFGCSGTMYNNVPWDKIYDSEHPLKLPACPADDILNPQIHSFTAIQATIADVNWIIENRVSDQFVVIGKACMNKRNLSTDWLTRTDVYCVSIVFKVEENGDIFAFRQKDKEVSYAVIMHRLENWMRDLSRNYAELRCYSDEALGERVAGQKTIK